MRNRLTKLSGATTGTAALALLFLVAFASGCGEQKAANRADEEQKFLAPTDMNKLTPAAREALSRMPGGEKAPPPGAAPAAPK